jgi:hypothetical protein
MKSDHVDIIKNQSDCYRYRMTRSRVFLALLLSLSLISAPTFAAVKAGAKCTKAGATATAGGKKFTCIKSGTRLVWNKGVAVKAAPKPTSNPVAKPVEPTPNPVATSTAKPTPTNFEPWSTNIDAKMLSDQAQRNFLSWAQTRTSSTTNHLQLIQENSNQSRISILKKADDLGASLFSSYFLKGSTTVIGATEAWTISELTKSGWPAKSCNERYMPGVALCLDSDSRQGYVITGDATYSELLPGNDGGALLAHEYFHLVQANLSKTRPGEAERTKGTNASSANAFPAWFLEGSAEFVGYSVGALAQNASYWEGRARMLSYSPPEESINKNAIADYEIRTCCSNNTPTYPYHIGQIATEFIVASIGFQKMLDIWVGYATTRNFEKSFETATGISKEAFYEKFEQLRPKVGLPPVTWKLDGVTNKKIGG